MRRRIRPLHAVLSLLPALALGLLAFAHQPVRVGTAEAAAYVLPDGSAAVICRGEGADEQGTGTVGGDCDACRLSASVLLPQPSLAASLALEAARHASAAGAPPALVRPAFAPAAPPTAPPTA
ncbi:MAG: hypothetical protein BroJett030_30380 [Alphaproteobacteria bacterium]|nr:MAG: hypothetical protein BroJett030_30380 [Alphaproteobacteria bacterium]